MWYHSYLNKLLDEAGNFVGSVQLITYSMLQDALTIRYYQRLSDALVELWNRGYRYDDLRLYIEGYLASLRHSNGLEPYMVHRLEEEIIRYLNDPSNFETPMPEPERDWRAGY
jgi:hypothetical protein